jgi:DNA/RNA endonuclease YhcR with UshA esterase domain
LRYFLTVSLLIGYQAFLTSQENTPKYTVNEAQTHIGEYAIVTVRVSEVFIAKSGNVFLDFGGTYPHQTFSAVIFKQNTDQFKYINSFNGEIISVEGEIILYRGKPEIIITSLPQIKIEVQNWELL